MVGSILDLAPLVEAAGLRCGRCGDGRCARRHDLWYRKRVTDLSTGEVFENLPILRAVFCDGSTRSLLPAELWRGRFTVTSVVETTVRTLRDGVEAAYDWTWYAGTGEAVVSRRSLRRWRDLVRRRLVGSSLTWLGPLLGFSWSGTADEAAQLETLLDKMTGPPLVAFRAATGHAVLDKPPRPRSPSRSAPRRIPGRLDPAPPQTVPSAWRVRGAWSRPFRRARARPPTKEARPP